MAKPSPSDLAQRQESEMLQAHSTSQPRSAAGRAIICILNGAAGSKTAARAKNRVAASFKAHGASVRVVMAKSGGELADLARQAVDEGASVVVAAGGDGTISAVASALVKSNIALGVLPLGTLNHFAKDMGIPTDLDGAVSAVLTGRIVRVDVGVVNEKIFLNNSSLGLYPAIVRQRDGIQKKGHGKWLAFLLASLNTLRRYQCLYVRLRTEGQPQIEEETPFVFIGNNQYQVCGVDFGARDRLDAGCLWVYRAPRATRTGLLRLAFQTLRGRHDTGELKVLATGTLAIRTKKRHLHVARDGEVETMKGPLNYSILPKALCVVAPEPSASGQAS